MSRAHRRAARRPAGQRERGVTIRPAAADHIAVPPPGLTACPVCTLPGYAQLDIDGVRILHQGRRFGCRYRGLFTDLVTVADVERQDDWAHCTPDVACPRCTHRRSGHADPPSPGGATPCDGCGCPGPYYTPISTGDR